MLRRVNAERTNCSHKRVCMDAISYYKLIVSIGHEKQNLCIFSQILTIIPLPKQYAMLVNQNMQPIVINYIPLHLA